MHTTNTDIIFEQFNKTIERWIGFLDDYTLEMLLIKPAETSWSLGQVYTHLIDDTSYFVGQIKIALTNNLNLEEEMHEDAKTLFENNEFPDMLLDGPSTNLEIKQPASKGDLLQRLTSIKKEIGNLFTTHDFSAAKGKTRHPGLQFFTALEWLRFADMHLRHHLRQKKRIDERLSLNNKQP